MIRTLTMIAVAGFLLAAVCLSIAVGIAGPDAIASSAWGWDRDGWFAKHVEMHDEFTWKNTSGQAMRKLAWKDANSLQLDVPADVHFVQGEGSGMVTFTGPKEVLDHLAIDNGRIHSDGVDFDHGQLQIEIVAPHVTRFDVHGSDRLEIEGYKQDNLALTISGDAEVTVRGATKAVNLDISGSGDADLGGLENDAAEVRISGSGHAKVGPKVSAKLDISGSGDVELTSHPKNLETHVSGSGEINQSDDGGPEQGASAAPGPAPSPAKPART